MKKTNNFKSVKIGKQVWMTENLNTGTFCNGDTIPEAKTNEEWEKAGEEGKPAWCYYENSVKNGKKYGKLYNWHAVNDRRGLAPKGWYIPSKNEFEELLKNCGGEGLNAYEALIPNGSSGFNSLCGGWRTLHPNFVSLGVGASFWSAKQAGKKKDKGAWFLLVDSTFNIAGVDAGYKSCGHSVRCLKKEESSCFIATAAFASSSPEISVLCQFRDKILRQHTVGRMFVSFYYTVSPPLARWIACSSFRRRIARRVLLPAVNIAKKAINID